MKDKNNSLLTPEQVAQVLQLHTLTVYSYIRQGKLDAIRFGRNYRVTRKDLTHFVDSHRLKKQKVLG